MIAAVGASVGVIWADVEGGAKGGVAKPGAYFARCSEAWAAGVAPLYANEPGYRTGLDGDGDGIACEPYRR